MLVAAALVPPTGLLVPGVAGRAEVLTRERAAASSAVAALVAQAPDRVVVLRDEGGDARLDPRSGPPRAASLRAAGVPDDAWLSDPAARAAAPQVTDVRAAVALWLLDRAGWSGEVLVRGVAGRSADDVVREVGAGPAGPTRVALLLVGGGSVRRGPDAPLADDPRAAEVDEGLVAWLTALGDPRASGQAPEPAAADVARHGLDAVPPARVLAAALPGSGLGPGAVAWSVPLGATYLVGTWLPSVAAGEAS